MKYFFFGLLSFLFSGKVFSQNKFVYMDTAGKILSDSEFKELSKRPFSMEKIAIKDGKTYVAVTPRDLAEIEKETKIREEKSHALLNKPLPPFIWNDIYGKKYNSNNLKGKVLVLNFWFVECDPCIRELPQLNSLVTKLKNRNVVFMAPSFSSRDKIISFQKKRKFKYNLIANAEPYINAIGISSFPTNVIVDRNGVIRFVSNGFDATIESKLADVINSLLQ